MRDRRQIEARQADLAAALDRLQSLKSDLASASVAAPTAASFGGAMSSGDYVFPVGGGPDSVSVAHTHHDYPAADIAAPEGSPLFALADSVVVDAYADGSGRCGIGFTIQLDGGAEYVYCHLSYLEPSVVPGAALAAGAPVGLVGSTGHATGPHLHLQFSCSVLSAGRAVVPVLRRRGVQLAGRTDPHAQTDRAQESPAFHGRRDHSRVLGNPHRGLYSLGA